MPFIALRRFAAVVLALILACAPCAVFAGAYVTQPSGKLESVRHHFFLPDEMPKPRPGSVVFVPEGDGQPKRDWIPLVTGLAQIIGSTVAIVVAVTR